MPKTPGRAVRRAISVLGITFAFVVAASIGPDRAPTDAVTVLIGLAVAVGVVAILERHQRRHLLDLRDDDADGRQSK